MHCLRELVFLFLILFLFLANYKKYLQNLQCETREALEQGTLATDAVLFIDTGTYACNVEGKREVSRDLGKAIA